MTGHTDRTSRPGRNSAGVALVVVLLAAALACTPAPTGGGSGPGATTSTTLPLPTDTTPFTVVFVGDSEARMRGNTDSEVAGYVRNLIDYRSSKVLHFAYDNGRYRVDPRLVILGGDISADRDTSVAADLPIWQQLYDNGIGFIAGFGNHDWDPPTFGDGSAGYSVAGNASNESTTAFTRETYRRTAELDPDFTYDEVGPTSSHGPFTFHATYRGVEIVNFNTFLYQPSYAYPENWPLSCNLLGGGAGCETFVSAEPQIAAMERRINPDPARTLLVVQHYPLSTPDSWWDDFGASGTTLAQRKDRLLRLMSSHDHVALLAGHNHAAGHFTHAVGGRTLDEYVAPYFGGTNGVDPTQGGGFVALLVSPVDGILEVKTVPGGTSG